MLAQSVMIVVFVYWEKITNSMLLHNGFEKTLNGLSKYKSAKETRNLETRDVERGKPRERETQILVGELLQRNKNGVKDYIFIVDKCLPLI